MKEAIKAKQQNDVQFPQYSSQVIKSSPKQPSKDFYLSMLDLEEKLFSQKLATTDRINSLVSKYAQCVEYFDFILDPIKLYFLEKIQITLSSLSLLSVLIGEGENSKTQSPIKRTSSIQTDRDQIDYISDNALFVPKLSPTLQGRHLQEVFTPKKKISRRYSTQQMAPSSRIFQEQQSIKILDNTQIKEENSYEQQIMSPKQATKSPLPLQNFSKNLHKQGNIPQLGDLNVPPQDQQNEMSNLNVPIQDLQSEMSNANVLPQDLKSEGSTSLDPSQLMNESNSLDDSVGSDIEATTEMFEDMKKKALCKLFDVGIDKEVSQYDPSEDEEEGMIALFQNKLTLDGISTFPFPSNCNERLSQTQGFCKNIPKNGLYKEDQVYDQHKKKIERTKRVDMYMKVRGQTSIETDPSLDITNILSGYEQSLKTNDEIITLDITKQMEIIQEKILKKKAKIQANQQQSVQQFNAKQNLTNEQTQ